MIKIYKHEYNSWRNTVNVYEIEAEEKPKTYIFKNVPRGVWETRITKDDIGKLTGRCGYKMFSFSSDSSELLKLMIADKEKHIEAMKNNLAKEKEEKYIFEKLFNEMAGEG